MAGISEDHAIGMGAGLSARPLTALSAIWPDHAHRDAALAGVGHDVGGPAVGPRGLASHAAYSSSASSTMSLLAAMWDADVDSVNGSRWTAAALASRSSYSGLWSGPLRFVPFARRRDRGVGGDKAVLR